MSDLSVLPTRRIGGLGQAATILVGVVVVLDLTSTWTIWHAYWLVGDFIDGVPGITEADLDSADSLVSYLAWVYVIGAVAAGIVFLTWLWRARVNAELLCPAYHRRARGWIIWGWICPVVNTWFPFMIVDDVHRASRPDNPPDLIDLRSVPGRPVLGLWWGLWIGSAVIAYLSSMTWRNAITIDSLRTSAVMDTISSAATIGAAVTVTMIVREISTWQDGRTSA